MGVTIKHTWQCDGCDDHAEHKGAGIPNRWMEGAISTVNGLSRGARFYLCETCSIFLYENKRKGATWLQRLKKAITPRPAPAKEE